MRRATVLIGLWVMMLGASMAGLTHYHGTPSKAAEAVQAWPEMSSIGKPDADGLLIVFLHPRCPCARATLTEMERLLRTASTAPRVEAVFIRPGDESDAWAESSTWIRAGQMAGVKRMLDPEGREARRYGAWTSGQTFFYDGGGALRYAGGITASRGHAGPNRGTDVLLNLIDGSGPSRFEFPVFGCPLFHPADDCAGACSSGPTHETTRNAFQ